MLGRHSDEFYNVPVISSILIFALNNWWLKYSYHNWITGKLSDFLFCFFFPIYLSALLSALTGLAQRVRIMTGALLTLLLFVAMKTSYAFSHWVTDILSIFMQAAVGIDSKNIVDPSDLIATPAIILSVFFVLRGNVESGE